MKLTGITAEQVESNRMSISGQRARAERDCLMREVVDTYNAARWEEMTEAEKQSVRDYRQALRDIPQQPGFPDKITWPDRP